jgi:hypothetical protein
VSFDFIESDGKLYAIECNPRTTSGVHLYCDDERIVPCFVESPGKRDEPVLSAYAGTKTFKGILLLLMPSFLFGGHFAQYAKAWFRGKDVVWSANDPLPALYQLYDMALYFWESIIQKKKITVCMTEDIEFDG